MFMSVATAKRKLQNKRLNARKRGLVCTLSFHDIRALYSRNNGYCDYTGEQFKESDCDLQASIERIDDTKGYIRGNCCLVTVRANQLKDVMFDKTESNSIKLKREAISDFDIMRTKLTTEYLEFLKKKYDPTIEIDELEETDNMQEIKQLPITTSQEPEIELNMDVLISQYYFGLSKRAEVLKQDFNLSFHEFKRKFRATRCKFTNNVLEPVDRYVLIIDNDKPINKDNLIFVDKKVGLELVRVSNELGLSIRQLSKGFGRII